jgi:hypothetical protein
MEDSAGGHKGSVASNMRDAFFEIAEKTPIW